MQAIPFNAATYEEVGRLGALTRWRNGLRALREVAEDPDRTDLVLTAGMYLNASREAEAGERVLSDPLARRMYEENRTLDSSTLDYDALLALPEGTLGHAYARFMRSRNLTPDLFRVEGRVTAAMYAVKRVRQSHDLWHVITGCATDVPGEIELQAFTYAQLGIPLSLLIVLIGTLRHGWRHPGLLGRIPRAFLAGKRAKLLAMVPWEELWETPLESVRASLNCPALHALA